MFVESSRSIHGECDQQRLCESDSTDVQTVLVHSRLFAFVNFLSYCIKKSSGILPPNV